MKSRSKRLPHKKHIYRWIASMLIPIISFALAWSFNTEKDTRSTSAPVTVERLSSQGQEIDLYANQSSDNLTKIYSDAINSAKDSVLLLVYSITDPTIIKALRTKAESGIPVHVITDAKTSPGIEDRLGPKVSLLKRYGDGLMHMKILVTDHKDILLGSANMTSESLKMHGNLVTGINSPAMAEVIERKAEMLRYDGSGAYIGQHDFDIGGQQVELWFLPDNHAAIYRIQRLIDNAKKTIRIAMFTWTRRDLAYAVINAHKRGVDVEVVIDYNAGRGAGVTIVDILKKNGITVHLSRGGPLLHHKFMYVDSNILVNGSANWTRAAFKQNNDCFIILNELTSTQQQSLNNLWKLIFDDSLPAR